MALSFERAIGWTACAAAVVLLIAAMLLGTNADAADRARVFSAMVRLPAVAGRPAAGYFRLVVGGKGDTLVEVASPLAQRIELHSNSMAGGVMRMDKLPAVKLLPGETVVFAPGGNHLMIFGLAPTLQAGATLPLVLRFASGATLKVDAATVAAGAAMPAAHAH